ncbi:acyltransferase family protein [Crocosphaera chwakensis]|uniref:Acyltransferase family protein n=1 Tax=Crocosphaera chwakensis CCY0110 TaxID=391612 RepID=A3IXV8_9CHRO|nr:acyltransferase [Crocosphaera chwakensis]EAZ88671.1 acyltransferase family protein [Crocosphaera chwakensis CCY0110]
MTVTYQISSSKKYIKKLDYIRGFAAFYVLIYHIFALTDFMPEIVENLFFSFGQEAVILFFLLSGFVIYLSVYPKTDLTFHYYFIRRFRRIYFPLIVALFLSVFLAILNQQFIQKFSWSELLGNLLMLQDFSAKPGILVRPFLANYPLWSLSYEWWFYLLFFPFYKSILFQLNNRIYFVFIVSFISYVIYIIYPNAIALYLAYFIIWWCGVEAADIYLKQQRFTVRSMKPILICLFLMSIISFIPVISISTIRLGYYPFLNFRHFASAFLAILAGLIWYVNKLRYFDSILGFFYIISPISYGIYILHYPILAQLHLHKYGLNLHISLEYTLKLLLIFSLAYLVEIKLQPMVNRWLK